MALFICFTFCVLFLNLLFHSADGVSSMAIDLGSEFMKVAVVLPSRPMDIVLNIDSQRKTSTSIGFRNGERFFGHAAQSLVTKYPELVFQSVPSLVGKHIDDQVVKDYMERYPYHNLTYDNSTGQLIFTHVDGMTFTPEELVAMLFEYAYMIVKKDTEVDIRTCVVTVPSFYKQHERRRLKYAIELAGLELLQLINDNTAVGINFGLSRYKSFKETPQYFLFYDMGALSTTVTLIVYQYGKHREAGVVTEQPIMKVQGVSHDPTLGTSFCVRRLHRHYANHFNKNKKIAKSDIFQNNRALSKLYAEFANVFVRLSANADTFAQIENLLEDEDMRLKVLRSEMEELCSDLFDRARRLVVDLLNKHPIDQPLSDIVLMGCGSRIPKIQNILMEVGQKSELNKGVNSDEAAALGGAYQAAFHTPGFRVSRFVVKDYNLYPIGIDFHRVSSSSDSDEKYGVDEDTKSPVVRQELFPRGALFPQKRSIKFNKHVDDFEFNINYINLTDEDKSHIGGQSYVCDKELPFVYSVWTISFYFGFERFLLILNFKRPDANDSEELSNTYKYQ